METRVWGGLSLLIIIGRLGLAIGIDRESAGTCARVSGFDLLVGLHQDWCFAEEAMAIESVGIVEGDEAALQWALNLVYKHKKTYVAVLFHASWCPFSKICLQNFNSMASLFPSIRHFAFEESVIRPRILSRYGVHGFPTLFLLNSTMRVRYHGSRTISSLISFYSDVTGIKSADLDPISINKAADTSSLPNPDETIEENCPFSWARSPEKILQQDTYLALASIFVSLKLLYFLIPKLNSYIERTYRRLTQLVGLLTLWDHFHAYLHEAKQSLSRLNPCKRSNHMQEEAMNNAKAWASKSLASVSIGEPSSSEAVLNN